MLVAMYSSCSYPVELPCTSYQLTTEAATYTTQQRQGTNIHALCGIRNRDPSNQAASDLRVRQHGYRVRLLSAHALCCRRQLQQ